MKKCALCQEAEANKDNTHYLTDGIIRTCLNHDGSKVRDRGLYFRFESKANFIDVNFQRSTPIYAVNNALQREISDEDIEKAKAAIPFSVNKVFCSNCEDIFTIIENTFIKNHLSRFRDSNLTGKTEIVIDDVINIRLFFLIQVWRTSVCTNEFKINSLVSEELRRHILNYKSAKKEDLSKYPITVTYLQTLGGAEQYTSNTAGYTIGDNPYIIYLNDFIIQFYDNYDLIKFEEFYGLNNIKTYKDYINYKENEFKLNVFSDQERNDFLIRYTMPDMWDKLMNYLAEFTILYNRKHHRFPSVTLIEELKHHIVNDGKQFVKFTKEHIESIYDRFITR